MLKIFMIQDKKVVDLQKMKQNNTKKHIKQ